MSVTSVRAVSSEGGYDADGSMSYTAVYHVTSDSTNDQTKTILNATGLPQFGDTFAFGTDSDPNASVRTARAKVISLKDSRCNWEVTFNYSSKGAQEQSQNPPGGSDPIDWGWKVSGNFATKMIAPTKDRNGRALVNLVEEPFLPPPETDEGDLLLVWEKNNPYFSLSTWAAVRNKVNSASIWGLERRQVKLKSWQFQVQWVNRYTSYTSNRIEFAINTNPGFYYEPLNCGFRQFAGFDEDGKAKYEVARSEEWVPLNRPRLLDDTGRFLPDGSDPTFFDQEAGDLQRFELEDEYDFRSFMPAVIPGPFIP